MCAEAVGDEAADIRRAWAKRQDTIRSAHFQWTSTHSHAPGSIRPAALSPTGQEEPKQPFTFVDPAVALWVDGAKFRYQHEQCNYAARMAQRPVSQYTSTFDGDVSADFTSVGSYEHGTGIICSAPTYNDLGDIHLWAVLLWCRPMHPGILDAGSLRVVKGASDLKEGRNLVLVASPSSASTSAARLWLDPSRGFTIDRYTALNQGKPSIELSITYAAHKVHGWVPSAWTIKTLSRDGTIMTNVESAVTHCAVNEYIPPDTFRLRFPPDTIVADRRAQQDYLVLSDGGRRVITKGERMLSFDLDALKRTRTGELLQGADGDWRNSLLPIVVLIMGIVASVVAFSRYRRQVAVDG
jgi:hypothetical protein